MKKLIMIVLPLIFISTCLFMSADFIFPQEEKEVSTINEVTKKTTTSEYETKVLIVFHNGTEKIFTINVFEKENNYSLELGDFKYFVKCLSKNKEICFSKRITLASNVNYYKIISQTKVQ